MNTLPSEVVNYVRSKLPYEDKKSFTKINKATINSMRTRMTTEALRTETLKFYSDAFLALNLSEPKQVWNYFDSSYTKKYTYGFSIDSSRGIECSMYEYKEELFIATQFNSTPNSIFIEDGEQPSTMDEILMLCQSTVHVLFLFIHYIVYTKAISIHKRTRIQFWTPAIYFPIFVDTQSIRQVLFLGEEYFLQSMQDSIKKRFNLNISTIDNNQDFSSFFQEHGNVFPLHDYTPISIQYFSVGSTVVCQYRKLIHGNSGNFKNTQNTLEKLYSLFPTKQNVLQILTFLMNKGEHFPRNTKEIIIAINPETQESILLGLDYLLNVPIMIDNVRQLQDGEFLEFIGHQIIQKVNYVQTWIDNSLLLI